MSDAKSIIDKRQKAYKLVFNPENLFLKTVMEDLARFCRANESTFHPDARAHAVLEGRREVYLRIQAHLNLSVDELVDDVKAKKAVIIKERAIHE